MRIARIIRLLEFYLRCITVIRLEFTSESRVRTLLSACEPDGKRFVRVFKVMKISC